MRVSSAGALADFSRMEENWRICKRFCVLYFLVSAVGIEPTT